MNDQHRDHLGCFTFKTSVETCQDEIYDSMSGLRDSRENQENDCNTLNISSQTYSLLKASAIAQYQTEMKKMETLVCQTSLILPLNGLTGELESQRHETERLANDKENEVKRLQ